MEGLRNIADPDDGSGMVLAGTDEVDDDEGDERDDPATFEDVEDAPGVGLVSTELTMNLFYPSKTDVPLICL